MKLPLPPQRMRRRLRGILADAFVADDVGLVKVALRELSAFYEMKPPPRVELRDAPLVIKGAIGVYYPVGHTIVLVEPQRWRQKRRDNTERKWVATIYHEFFHALTLRDEERRADAFAERMML